MRFCGPWFCRVNIFFNRRVYKDKPLYTYFDVRGKRCYVRYVEHVVVHMTLKIRVDSTKSHPHYDSTHEVREKQFSFSTPCRGAVSVVLHSPKGTQTVILPYRINDLIDDEGYYHWPFTSVQHWGEDPIGLWNLTIYFNAEGGHVKLSNLSMTLYGTEKIPDAVSNIPSECSEECSRGCSGSGSDHCDACINCRIPETLECVPSCSIYACNTDGYCQECNRFAVVMSLGVVVPTVIITSTVLISIFAVYAYKTSLFDKVKYKASGFRQF